MSSNRDERLARLGDAINELAVTMRTRPSGEAGVGESGEAGIGELADRLAGIWAMIAELDPAVAARLPRYCAGCE
jgi:hypothetical protein